jgi:8-oxo-dGTP pyrophosphatase MutT (NUDIX family)
MSLSEVRLQQPNLRQATLAFLVSQNKVLLAMKKRGFGKGKWNGAGGKQDNGENIEQTAKRELWEEMGITATEMVKVGEIEFYFDTKPEWSQKVIVFRVDKWEGEPIESEEMAPKWFEFDQVPYDQMWEDDRDWLPLVLDGKSIEAGYLFDETQKLIEKELREV